MASLKFTTSLLGSLFFTLTPLVKLSILVVTNF